MQLAPPPRHNNGMVLNYFEGVLDDSLYDLNEAFSPRCAPIGVVLDI